MKIHHHNDDPSCLCCTDGIDVYMEKVEEIIKREGHAIIGTQVKFMGEDLNLAYTVGLTDLRLPEIFTFSLPQKSAAIMLNSAVVLLKQGKLVFDSPVKNIANVPVYFKEVNPSNTAGFINIANLRAKRFVAAIQLVWPDQAGNFMWDADYEMHFLLAQPALFLKAH